MIYPDLLEKVTDEDRTILILANGTLVTGFEIELIDAETNSEDFLNDQLLHFVRSLSPKVLVRFMFESKDEDGPLVHSRDFAVSKIGYCKNSIFVFFEMETFWLRDEIKFLKTLFKKDNFLNQKLEEFRSTIKLAHFQKLGLRMTSLHDYSRFFVKSKISVHDRFVAVDEMPVGILKFVKQSTNALSLHTLARIKDLLPKPFNIVTTFKVQSSQKAETILRQKSNQAEVGADQVAMNKFERAQEDLTKITLYGNKIASAEISLVMTRYSEAELIEALNLAKDVLRPLGNFDIETFGTFESFKATLIGQLQHVPFDELDDVLVSYFPIISFGKSYLGLKPNSRSLILHRLDHSLDDFDLYNPKYDSFSTCIFGMPGSGKSVLTNMITRALANDPNVQIIKLDVGGSHSRETKLLGGVEFELTIDKPCGFNPFSIFSKHSHSPEIIQVLSTFLETLLREEGEVFLKKEMKADIESSLSKYSESRPEFPTLDDFIEKHKSEIPRVKLLERWSGNGVFANAFKENEQLQEFQNTRLKYFNFSKISQALDSDFAQGGLASVMAAFNFDILFNRNGKRFVFIADEVPVFIERCFSFFALSIANIRKNGDAFITIAQRSEHVVVNGNTSILDNSPSKFIFTVDGNPDAFKKRTGFSEEEVLKIKNLKRVQGEFSDVFYKDQIGSRTFRIILSPEEYWSYTSKKEDKDKIQKLMEFIPDLTLKESIACLGR